MIGVALECTNYMVLEGGPLTPPDGMNRSTLALHKDGWALEICFENKKIPKVLREGLYNFTAVYKALHEMLDELHFHATRIDGPGIHRYMDRVAAYVAKYPVR